MIEKWWQKIPEKFQDIEVGQYQIMPNHFHAIVINVGADPPVCPQDQIMKDPATDVTANNERPDLGMHVEQLISGLGAKEGEHLGSATFGDNKMV